MKLSFEIFCADCGESLGFTFRDRELNILPCENCITQVLEEQKNELTEQHEKALAQRYDEGHADGVDAGYDEGHTEGIDAGYEAGYDQAIRDQESDDEES